MRILAVLLGAAIIFSCNKNEKPRFERLDATTTGIDFNNEVLEKDTFNILHNEYMYNGGGVGVADLNNDELQDLVFTGNKVTTRIYLNEGGFKFKDITDHFEGLDNKQWVSGATAVDINADGLTDLYFSCTMSKDSLLRKNQLWVNQGGGDEPTFKEMADEYGIAEAGYSMHSAFLDYDLDGDLDLYVLNNIVTAAVPTNYHNKIIDGSSVNNDAFYENLGNGKFKNITIQSGVVYEGYGLGIAVGDVNKDGYPDLYISNDYVSNDLLYINTPLEGDKGGKRIFKNLSPEYLSYHSRFSMGNDMADINHDGNLDIMSVDMMPEQYARKKQTINGNGYNVYTNNEKYGYEPQYVRNMLQLHSGFINGQMQPFSEVGMQLGIYQTEWSWSPLFADYDNDGDRDLLMTNGFPKDLTDKDFTNYKAQVYGYLAGDKDILPKIPIVKVPNYAFENISNETEAQSTIPSFANHTKEWGLDIPSFSNGAAYVDLDNDGDLDYVTNNINDPAFVYRNTTIAGSSAGAEGNNDKEQTTSYLRIALTGNKPNTMAIGSKIELWSGGRLQYYEHFLTRGYISSVDPVVHFGLGKGANIDSLRVIWPLGKTTTLLTQVKPNQLLNLKEAEAKPYSPPTLAASPLFEKMDSAIAYQHVQNDYVDFFQNQRILQHKFSQVGPCFAKGDLDGDGQDDLLIGGSADSPTTVFLVKNGGFQQTEIPGLTGKKTCLESDMAILDLDGDGDMDVLASAGGYANENKEEYRHCAYFNQNSKGATGKFERVELPAPPYPASVVRPADFDKDGDMDIFIGARVEKNNFPKAASSMLLINNGGKFDQNQPLDLGMVTDATWSDIDGDGFADLLVAREWGSVAAVMNKGGKKLEITENQSLATKNGLWYSVTATDLDKDGDDDYVLGNLGENHRFTVSDKYPLKLYAADLDKNGAIDPVAAAFWKDKDGKMQEYPVNYLDELASQSPFFKKIFTSYTRFSFATMDTILGGFPMPKEAIIAVNTTSSYIIWNDKGKFTWERLPAEAQVAPIKKVLADDFNGDGLPDLLLVGNDHSFDVSTGYYDSNRGVVLLGKGKRSFEVLPAAKSGLGLRGQVDALAYFKGETPMLVLGVNRKGVEVFRWKKGKENL